MNQQLKEHISQNKRLTDYSQFIALKKTLTGKATILKRVKILGSKILVPVGAIAAGGSDTTSELETVGTEPDGFGFGFVWDRKTPQVLLAVFINAADSLGVSIDGLQQGDLVEVTSADGIASFAEDEGNPFVSGLIGVLGAGADLAATIAGFPEAIPLLNAADKFAQDQFKATHVKTKRRDAYGQDPGNGQRAKEEGGVLVCMPAAKGPYYSSSNSNMWIKDEKPRSYENLPSDFIPDSAFFLNRENPNSLFSSMAGQAYIIAWDWKFEDNAGYYKIFIRLTRSDSVSGDGPINKIVPSHAGITVVDHRHLQ